MFVVAAFVIRKFLADVSQPAQRVSSDWGVEQTGGLSKLVVTIRAQPKNTLEACICNMLSQPTESWPFTGCFDEL